jgi:hypothetical protein
MNEHIVALFIVIALVFTQCKGKESGKTMLDLVVEGQACVQR